MTKDQLWKAYCARNPIFGKPGAEVTLTSDGLKKLFDQTWDMAWEEGVRATEESDTPTTFEEVFGRIKP